jgi:hypothetical protein
MAATPAMSAARVTLTDRLYAHMAETRRLDDDSDSSDAEWDRWSREGHRLFEEALALPCRAENAPVKALALRALCNDRMYEVFDDDTPSSQILFQIIGAISA